MMEGRNNRAVKGRVQIMKSTAKPSRENKMVQLSNLVDDIQIAITKNHGLMSALLALTLTAHAILIFK